MLLNDSNVLGAFYVLYHVILTTNLWDWSFYSPYFKTVKVNLINFPQGQNIGKLRILARTLPPSPYTL